MMYFWLIPLVLILIGLAITFLNKGTKDPEEGVSRMDEARRGENRSDLHT